MRWSVAAAATAALVVSGSGLVVFAQSGDGASQGPEFVPAGAAGYVEARLDMPAGQQEALAQMLTAFPGFADPGSFDLKVDELVGGLSSEMGLALPEGDLFGDVLTGELGLALSDLEGAMMGGEPQMLIGLAVADAEAAAQVMEALVADAPATMAEETYSDTTIMTDPSSEPPMSVAIHDDWLLLGTGPDVVKSSIDSLDGAAPSLAEDPDFVTAWSRLPSPRLGAAYLDLSSLVSFAELASMMAEGETGMTLPMEDLEGMWPTDMVASLVAENDRLTLDVLVTPGPNSPSASIGESDLALSFPADTQVYLETRELGAVFEDSLNGLAELLEAQQMMAADEPMDPTDPMSALGDVEVLFGEDSPLTAMFGVPLPELLDFVGDAGVGAGLSSDGLWLGIAGELDDPVEGTERVTNLLTVLRMFTLQANEEDGVDIGTEMVGDIEVTTITLPLDEALAESGVPLTVGDTISVALTDDTLLIGLGDFVQTAILSDGTDSLGTSPGYIDALAGDTPNAGVMYMNLGSLVAALDPMLAMMAPEWSEIAPYAAGLDRMIVVPNEDDEVASARMTVIAGQ
jgi:hypothetical protein